MLLFNSVGRAPDDIELGRKIIFFPHYDFNLTFFKRAVFSINNLFQCLKKISFYFVNKCAIHWWTQVERNFLHFHNVNIYQSEIFLLLYSLLNINKWSGTNVKGFSFSCYHSQFSFCECFFFVVCDKRMKENDFLKKKINISFFLSWFCLFKNDSSPSYPAVYFFLLPRDAFICFFYSCQLKI